MKTFRKGDTVEFQDAHFCWRLGTVQSVEDSHHVHVLHKDAFKGPKLRVSILPMKRVRRATAKP